jgi:uncharacterized membrane protein required for colicin V production
MTVPGIGFASIPDCVFAAYLLFMLFVGLMHGMGKELGSLAGALAALGVTIAPPVHNQAADVLSFLERGHAEGTAYAAVFYLVLALLKVFFSRVSLLRELKIPGLAGRLFGGISGLLRAALDITMFLILAATWKLPWEELFSASRIAELAALAWNKLDMFFMLYSSFHVGINIL